MRRRLLVLVAVVAVVVTATGGGYVLYQRQQGGQGMWISGPVPSLSAPAPRPGPSVAVGAPPYAVAVSADRRHLVDQAGRPLLVQGDSPWSILTDVSVAEAKSYWTQRSGRGVNAAIVSLIGAEGNGGPYDDGRTFDGVAPFVDGDVLAWNDTYFQRVHAMIADAADLGITVFLYPIDGWTVGHSFVPRSLDQCEQFGARTARYFADLPNIAWMVGGDYFPVTNEPEEGSDVDHCFDAMRLGIRSTGDTRLFSIQLGFQKSASTDNPYWAPRVDWDFAYSYYPTYRVVLQSYARQPVRPVIMAEANYEGLNLQPETLETTNETLRRQAGWALTSGSAGDFYGSKDWKFEPGWAERLDGPGLAQVARIRALFKSLEWWRLVPDVEHRFLTDGYGTEITDDRALDVLESDYATPRAPTTAGWPWSTCRHSGS